MVVATIVVPGMFVLCANLLWNVSFGFLSVAGYPLGFLSVAVGWAVGYPMAFAVLAYLVVKAIDLPIGAYLRASWGIVGSCLAGFVVGVVVKLLLSDASDQVRLILVAGASMGTILLLLAFWQKITPRSIARSLKG